MIFLRIYVHCVTNRIQQIVAFEYAFRVQRFLCGNKLSGKQCEFSAKRISPDSIQWLSRKIITPLNLLTVAYPAT
jgi:hypothetical protein